jgi:4'-phosphopantetheinyl transferase
MHSAGAREDGLNEQIGSLSAWTEVPSEMILRAGEVHVWLLHADTLSAAALDMDSLAEDESARATRMGDAGFRSYVGTRVSLRGLLSRYAGAPARSLQFSYGALGKPALMQGGVHFSVSHAGDRAVLGFSRSFELGVDIERVKDTRRFESLSARFFSPGNRDTLAATKPAQLPRVFTEAWAQREAYVKAVGGGLYATADSLPFTPGRIPLQALHDDAGNVWTVASLDAGDDYEGKVVLRGVDAEFSFFRPT